jgi:hydroxymethylpyrimidine pyrophosphatase-like HAD family hydrolase
MIFVALASDYDGTLAQDGAVNELTREGIERLSGKKLILVTGRELPDLRKAFDQLQIFDAVVAENGALLFLPSTGEERLIGPAPPATLIATLQAKNVRPLSIGRGIIATWTPNEAIVLQSIRELGLDWQVIFNKGAVMCLGPGINKASGLEAALSAFDLSAFNTVAIGDAENDLAFMTTCGCSVAVANALDTVKLKADIITQAERGAGVCELIERWRDNSRSAFASVRRHDLYLGEAVVGQSAVSLRSDAGATLIAGSSGVGKSRLTALLLERITDHGYQACVIDPEGDYDTLSYLSHIGDPNRTAEPSEIVGLLHNPKTSVSVNLLGTEVAERPVYFTQLWGQLNGLRGSTGRPHWIVLDEAHHLSPRQSESHEAHLPDDIPATIFITTLPESVSLPVLRAVRTVIAVGDVAIEVIRSFCEVLGKSAPQTLHAPEKDQVLFWESDTHAPPILVSIGQARESHRRHTRKYAEGTLGEDKSFYFRGPEHKLNLRARNLAAFLQIAQGIDNESWLFHLRRGDYTKWFRESIKDEELATEVQSMESSTEVDTSRSFVFDAVKRRYAAADIP